jgi:hypothetical protein
VVLHVDRPIPLTLSVTDALGRTVQRIEGGICAAGEHRLPLNLAGLSSGAYFIRVENLPAPPQKVLLIR